VTLWCALGHLVEGGTQAQAVFLLEREHTHARMHAPQTDRQTDWCQVHDLSLIKIRSGLWEPRRVESRPFSLLQLLAFTTACTTIQTVTDRYSNQLAVCACMRACIQTITFKFNGLLHRHCACWFNLILSKLSSKAKVRDWSSRLLEENNNSAIGMHGCTDVHVTDVYIFFIKLHDSVYKNGENNEISC